MPASFLFRIGIPSRLATIASVVIASLSLTACGGGDSGGSGSSSSAGSGGVGGSTVTTYTIGGTVTGLSGTLVLTDNGADSTSLASSGNFAFKTPVSSGGAYSVAVASQPSGQNCTIANSSGIASASVTNVMVSCLATNAVVSGAITGLSNSGLILSDGTEVLSIDAQATTFQFPTSLAGGATYTVSVSVQPAGETCSVANGSGTAGNSGAVAPSLSCNAREWVWVSGSNTAGSAGNYGTLGVAAASNSPSARTAGLTWTDNSGNFWLYGGEGGGGALADLWEFSPGTGLWTWVAGTASPSAAVVFGTQGVAASTNSPGARTAANTWVDASGDLWLFGGGFVSGTNGGPLADLWRFSLSTKLWTWVGGSQTPDAPGVYGTQGAASPQNYPPARTFATSWTDPSGNFWLFGGAVYFAPGGFINDLWKFSPSTGLWTWVSGSNTPNALGVFGTIGTPGGVPGSRESASAWADAKGDLWLLGGFETGPLETSSFGTSYTAFEGNDLWVFSPSTGKWTWEGGTQNAAVAPAFGVQGITAVGNAPGATRDDVGVTDPNGNFYLFGSDPYFNDLWQFRPNTGQWIWIGGSITQPGPATYGTQGTAASSNWPGGREQAMGWTDSSGRLWIFGGLCYDSTNTSGTCNDLWEYGL